MTRINDTGGKQAGNEDSSCVWGEGREEMINVAWMNVSGPGNIIDVCMKRQSAIEDEIPRPFKQGGVEEGDQWSKNWIWFRWTWCQ